MENVTEDEIGLHTRAFNEMADTIEDNIRHLKETDELRRELIANVSHDLRTPVGAMLSLLETLRSEYKGLPEEKKEVFLERAHINCRDLNSLVNQLFELSKLNSNLEKPVFASVELKPLFGKIINKFISLSQKKNLGINVVVPKNIPQVFADENMLTRVLSNLVENAVRYSDSDGDISIEAKTLEDETVQISVSDTGPGISQKELEHIFDRFFRGSTASEKEKKGSGLGLAITKRIIELHGHTISAKSDLGKGTTFSFTLDAT